MSERRTVILEDGKEYEIVEGGGSRSTFALALILVLLIGLLGVLGYFLFRVGVPVIPGQETVAEDGLAWIRSIYGYGPSIEQQLSTPRDAAIGPDGTIWVSDGQNSRVIAFNADGTLKTSLVIERGEEEGQAAYIQGIDVSPDGSLYVCDQSTGKVLQFDGGGQFIREWPVPAAADVAASADRVAVVSTNGYATFTTDGELLEVFGTSRGTDDDKFDLPRGIALADDDTIYVADTANKRIKAYDADGNLLWISDAIHGHVADEEGNVTSVDASETAEANRHSLILPMGLDLDGAGHVVVADAFDFSLWVLDAADGSFVAHYGEFGQNDGSFVYPSAVSYDEGRDWFAVADTNAGRVQVLRLPGSGDSLVAKARRMFVGPMWICAIPLAFLVAATIAVTAAKYRRGRTGGAS